MFEGGPLCCSFCRKSQEVVGKLISNPDYPRAYICDECVSVCVLILQDDVDASRPPEAVLESPLLSHPLASPLLEAVALWIEHESVGDDVAEEFAEVRRLAGLLVRASTAGASR